MKFNIFFLLLISTSSEFSLLEFQGASESDTMPMIYAINKLRRKIAKERNIANMNELTWDYHLEQIAETQITSCHSMEDGPDYMVSVAPNKKIMDKILFDLPRENQDKEILRLLGGLGAPGQTGFACAEILEPCSRNDGIEIKGVCLSGPRNTFTPLDYIHGKPGSKCSDGRKKKKGLCTVD